MKRGRAAAVRRGGSPLLAALLLLLPAGSALAGGPMGHAPSRAPAEEAHLATPPRLLRLVPALLPEDAVFPAEVVVVVLRIEVDAGGGVGAVSVERGPGPPFDDAAARAARGFRFAPGRLSTGEAVPVTVTFRMRIRRPPPPAPARAEPPAGMTLDGTLLERGTRRPLRDVQVYARPLETGAGKARVEPDRRKGSGKTLATATTDSRGRFHLVVPAPRFELVAVAPGHERLRAEIRAEAGELRSETFYLETTPSAYELVVRAPRARREVTRRVIPKALVDSLPGTAGDTIKAIQNFPGVARAPFGGGLVVLRGASPGDSRTFLEGHPIPQIYHFGGLRSTFNSAFLEAVDFVPGNFGPEHGRATGGVIDVRARDPDSEAFHGDVDLNLYDAGFRLEGPISDTWSVGAAFHRSWIDAVLPALLPDDAPISFDTAPRYYDYQILATWKPNATHELRLRGFGSLDRLALLFEEANADPKIRGALDSRVMFHMFQVEHRMRVAPGVRMRTSVQTGFQQVRFELGPDFFFNLDRVGVSLLHDWEVDLSPSLDLRAGLDARVDQARFTLSAPQPPKEGDNPVPISTQTVLAVDRRVLILSPAAYMELRIRPVSGIEILPSLRLDWFGTVDELVVDPRLTVRWQAAGRTLLKAAVGLYQQAPQPDESDEDFGTPDLLPERSLQASLGVEQDLWTGLSVDLTGFYKALDRVVTRNPEAFYDDAAPAYTNGGSGRIFGLELLLRFQPSPDLYGWVAYTFQRSFRTDGAGQAERPFDFDQPHILTALASWRMGAGWNLGLRFRLVSGNPETPVEGAIYDARSDTWVPTYGRTNSDRQALFNQIDVRVDKVWTFDTWKLSLYLDLQNAYNQANQEGSSYSFDYSRRTKLTGLPILPILGLKGSW